MSGFIDSLTRKREAKLRAGRVARVEDEILSDYAKDFDGAKLDHEMTFFGIRNAVQSTVIYVVALATFILFCVLMSVVFYLPGQWLDFLMVIVAFALLVALLCLRAWTQAGFMFCSEAFLGVYHLASQKKSETVPSRLRRVEFDSRWCKVTCADADEDFRLPRSDDGYLRFLAYLEPLDLEATKLVDYDELHKLQEGFN